MQTIIRSVGTTLKQLAPIQAARHPSKAITQQLFYSSDTKDKDPTDPSSTPTDTIRTSSSKANRAVKLPNVYAMDAFDAAHKGPSSFQKLIETNTIPASRWPTYKKGSASLLPNIPCSALLHHLEDECYEEELLKKMVANKTIPYVPGPKRMHTLSDACRGVVDTGSSSLKRPGSGPWALKTRCGKGKGMHTLSDARHSSVSTTTLLDKDTVPDMSCYTNAELRTLVALRNLEMKNRPAAVEPLQAFGDLEEEWWESAHQRIAPWA